jgi:hypothetical protein
MVVQASSRFMMDHASILARCSAPDTRLRGWTDAATWESCMLRLIDVLWASVLLAASCTSHQADNTGGPAGPAGQGSQTVAPPAPPPAPPPPTSVLEQVQHGAPAGVRVAAAGITITGIELFVLTDSKPVPDDGYTGGTLVGVVGGLGGKTLEGRELVRAVIAAKPNPKTLARVALLVAQNDAELLGAPDNPEQRKAKVRPPVIAHNTLMFWVSTTEVPRLLEKAKLDLATGALELSALPISHDKAIANAIASLTGVSVSMHTRAIKTLADACAEPKPRAALLGALASHPRTQSRAAVADAAHKCGTAAVGPLIDAMEHDKSALVRTQAAGALGRVGDPRARPALAKAAKSEDANLAWAANNALKKLQ